MLRPQPPTHRVFLLPSSLHNHDFPNGVSHPLTKRPARPAHSHQLDQPGDLLHPDNAHPSPTRNPSAPSQAALHLHPARYAVRRLLLRPAHYLPHARLQGDQGHAQHAALEPQFAEAVERGGGRSRQIGGFPCKVRQSIRHSHGMCFC